MVVLAHFSGSPNFNKIDKIPEYVGQYRKEWLIIRGISREFKYFVDNIDEATRGLFQNHRVAIIKKFIKRFLLAHERGRLQDTSNFVLERDDVDHLIKIDKNFNNFCQYIKFLKDFYEEEYVCPYPGMDSMYEVFKIFFNKFKVKCEDRCCFWDSDSDSE